MALETLKTGSVDLRRVVNAVAAQVDTNDVKTFGTPTFSVAAEAANAIAVTITLRDAAGVALAAKAMATVWISDSALGVVSATPPDGTVSFTTGTLLKEDTTKVLHRVVSSAAGVLVLSVGESTAKSFHVCVAVGNVTASQVITFA